jgi:hypothetical protein
VINAQQLLVDLTRQLKGLEADLRQRIAEQPDLHESLRDEWQAALDAKRCAETFETWADQVITQAGVHWLLSCVFLRFIEDNQLVDRPWLAGTPESSRLALARDRHEAYFRAHPLESDRDYLLAAFCEAGTLPGLHTFFDEAHNPVFRLGISGDAAMALRQFWQQVNTDNGELVRDFTDPTWNTRFLGNLYQDLSEATRKRYALLQTPEFVEEFILDRTLTPAIRSFGFREVRMIDPTCGSGHFLLGAFARLVDEWQRQEPGRNARDVAQKALNGVAGVDLNPFAVAISRFRLLLAALQVAGVRRLSEAPNFQVHVAIGDSLLHGTRFGLTGTQSLLEDDQFVGTGLAHAYASEDLPKVREILGRQYHAVVGNPPYILVRDAALNAAYRSRYASCHRQYSLGAPFTERFFDLAVTGSADANAGFVGLITASSFMNCQYGVKLIEEVLPRLDLTHVVDTAGAFIPGHGTSTVILLGRHRPALGDSVRTVMGIKSEPAQPLDPSKGLVWTAIVEQVDLPGSESEFISVSDTPRSALRKFPWSTGGGGLAELRKALELGRKPLSQLSHDAGYSVITGDDNALLVSKDAGRRTAGLSTRVIVEGDEVRNWSIAPKGVVLWPYDAHGADLPVEQQVVHVSFLWPYRTNLKDRKAFGVPVEEKGLRWWDLREIYRNRLKTARTITFGEIATHNHFSGTVSDFVFNRTAPVIQLAQSCSDDENFGLLGVLNSSVSAMLLRGICRPKEGSGIGRGIQNEAWEKRYAFSVTNVVSLPLPGDRPSRISAMLHACAEALETNSPAAILDATRRTRLPERSDLDASARLVASLREQMIALQEELDWQCYRLYELIPDGTAQSDLEATNPPGLKHGERAFEIALARRVASGDESTSWFERHGSTPITELPSHWPAEYRAVVERRIALIESDRNIGLIERPEFKRRWNTPAWEDLEKAALRDWLLDRLEQPAFWPVGAGTPPQLTSTSKLAEMAQADAEFMQVAALYAGHADFDTAQLVAELVAGEAVPLVPVLRYTEDGLRKRAQWEDTWALQRREDAIDTQVVADNAEAWRREVAATARTTFGSDSTDEARAWINEKLAAEIKRHQDERKAAEVGPIPVPPKYKSSDFLKADFWRLRSGLDVPRERFVSFPGAERGADGSLVVAWAGWNHLQLATALAGYYGDMKDNEGWEPARLQPLLASLLELVPWLEQWHNDLDPEFGQRMGTYYKGFVTEDARALGFTLDDLRAWKPAVTAAKRGRKRAAAASEG